MMTLSRTRRKCPREVPFTACLATVCFAANAGADELRPWDPGERTTTSLRGEVVVMNDKHGADGVYGRFDGDVTFALGLGAEFGNGARAGVLARSLYYHTAGLFLGYGDSLGGDSDMRRILFFGAEVRPLFLPRWSLDMQLGLPLVDLTLDSLAVSAGMYLGQWQQGAFAHEPGFETALGFGVPLLGTAAGPWLEARGTYRIGSPGRDLGVSVWLSFYESWNSPVVR